VRGKTKKGRAKPAKTVIVRLGGLKKQAAIFDDRFDDRN
jgi:hypothetical protein